MLVPDFIIYRLIRLVYTSTDWGAENRFGDSFIWRTSLTQQYHFNRTIEREALLVAQVQEVHVCHSLRSLSLSKSNSHL